jgi:hypothetical protein
MLLLLPILFGCQPPEPPPVTEPFISDLLVGRWVGEWSAQLPGQYGVADVSVVKQNGEINFDLSIWGGAIADESDPLEMILVGPDDSTELILTGHAAIAGDVIMLINPDGNITGTVDPDALSPVAITGWVRDYEFVLNFAVYGLIPGTVKVVPVDEDAT